MMNAWFQEAFLASLVEKAKQNANPKYSNRVILSQRQYAICMRYMTVKKCYGDYGDFYVLVYETDTHKFQVVQSGKYDFLYITEK